jgi:hypothetical protein
VARAHALSFDRGSLRLDAPATARVPPYFVWDERVNAWRTAAVNHFRVCEDAATYRLPLADQAPRFFPAPALRDGLPPLRPDQHAAIEAWEHAGHRGVIVKPTGTGKTEIALAIIARHRAPTLVVAPLRDLMYQWQRRIKKGLGFEAGVLGDGRQEVWPITVTTYDSAWIHEGDRQSVPADRVRRGSPPARPRPARERAGLSGSAPAWAQRDALAGRRP